MEFAIPMNEDLPGALQTLKNMVERAKMMAGQSIPPFITGQLPESMLLQDYLEQNPADKVHYYCLNIP